MVEAQHEGVDEGRDNDIIGTLNRVGGRSTQPYKAILEVNGRSLEMEIDTGAAVSIISKKTQESLFPRVSKPSISLRTYTSELIPVLGQLKVEVKHRGYVGTHQLVVVAGNGPALLGRDWLSKIRLDWASIKAVVAEQSAPNIEQLTYKYREIFQQETGTLRHFKAKLCLKEGVRPRFCRPRTVPFAITEKVGSELDRLEEAGVLRKVEYSEWAAPIVPVPKKDGSLRLCGDYKVTVNPALNVDQYPLPKPADLLSSLAGGQRFSKLDLTSAYQQVPLDEISAKLTTINTHQGLYEYTRLPFGVASAPAVFQRIMDTMLQGMPSVICYLDDILITGRNEAEHLRNLEKVLHRLQERE